MNWKKRFAVIVTLTAAVCGGYAGYLLNAKQRAASLASAPPVPAAAPVNDHSLAYWSFEDMDGQERHMSEWAGKLLVVNFWATWCPPCRKEIPGFITLQNNYDNDTVQFIGIALDRADAVREYAAEQGINYPLLIGEDAVAEYMRALGNTIGALPFSAVIGPDGRVIETHQGEWSQDDVDRVIRASL